MKKRWHFTYNAPLTLTFAIICALILLLDTKIFAGNLISALFMAPGCHGSISAFNPKSVLDYIRLFTHVFGHSDFNHLIGNLSFILLLSPLMEERYGSRMLTLMFVVTAIVTGVINVCLIPRPLLGASGIVFMLIILSSINNIDKKEIPITFVAILIIYIGRELFNAGKFQDVATFAHIAGGLCGSLFGFLVIPKAKRKSAKKQNQDDDTTVIGTINV